MQLGEQPAAMQRKAAHGMNTVVYFIDFGGISSQTRGMA